MADKDIPDKVTANSLTSLCAGKQLAFYRKKIGLTQLELAKISGYSERLVRKAESGGRVTNHALSDLAMALSHDEQVIYFEDLTSSPLQMATSLLSAYTNFEAEMVTHIRHFLDEEIVVRCAGDPQKIPFAGEWLGIDGFDNWARTFFATLTRPDKEYFQPKFVEQGTTVVAWGRELAHVAGLPYQPIWVTQRFEFSKGKLILFEDLFDTDRGSEHLAEAKAKGFLSK